MPAVSGAYGNEAYGNESEVAGGDDAGVRPGVMSGVIPGLRDRLGLVGGG